MKSPTPVDELAMDPTDARIYSLKRNAGMGMSNMQAVSWPHNLANTMARWAAEESVEVPPTLTARQYLDIINASPSGD